MVEDDRRRRGALFGTTRIDALDVQRQSDDFAFGVEGLGKWRVEDRDGAPERCP